MERHYVSKRSRRQPSVLVFLTHDAEAHAFCYADADRHKGEEFNAVFRVPRVLTARRWRVAHASGLPLAPDHLRRTRPSRRHRLDLHQAALSLTQDPHRDP